jgi:hypothetical protein
LLDGNFIGEKLEVLQVKTRQSVKLFGRCLVLMPGIVVLGCLGPVAFAQESNCEYDLINSYATRPGQVAPNARDEVVFDEQHLATETKIRLNRNADRARSTRNGIRIDLDIKKLIDSEFEAFDPAYLVHRDERETRLNSLRQKLDAAERPGHFLYCSEQLFILSKIYVKYTALWPLADAELDRLAQSINWPNQEEAGAQKPNGAWGSCAENFILELDRTVEALNRLSSGPDPRPKLAYPLEFLNQIERPDQLFDLLYARQISNIAASGVFNREGQGSLSESVPQLVFKSYLTKIASDNGVGFLSNQYRRSYLRFLDDTQDPLTGFWGPWLNLRDGIYRLLDLSMTYHIVAYRRGCVHNWPAIVDTLFEIKNLPYPYGWLWNGEFNDHNDYDIVRLLKLAWPKIGEVQKQRARVEIEEMLDWTLKQSFTPENRFIFEKDFYDTLGGAYYFTISFLDEIGFWRENKRFWLPEFPTPSRAAALCVALRAQLEPIAGNTSAAASAFAKLQENCPT